MTNKKDTDPHEGIDLTGLITEVWRRRTFVLRVTGVVMLAALFAALFGEVKYTAGSVIVPQTGQEATGGNLMGLAAMAGINLSGTESAGRLSPKLYPMVVSSVSFQKELMYTEIELAGRDGTVTLVDYLTERGLRRFSLFPFLRDYTIGLPRTVVNAMRRERPAMMVPTAATGNDGSGMETLSGRENEAMQKLSKLVTTKVNEQNGYISLSATMPEPAAAAQVAFRARELLQQYITRFKIRKVEAELEFIEERYNEVRADFETKQIALAAFRDANRDITSERARTRENRLENEYSLAFSLYSELARQLEQARIKVKEDTPVFTVIEPVTVPIERAAPKRARIMMIGTVAGLCAGTALVFILPAARAAFGKVKRAKKSR